jgi:nitronate monooxygenase
VVEGPKAGGHNAPPRGALTLDALGEPIYGPRDEPDFAQLRALGLPFWLAGSFADGAKLESAIALGARGIQVGTAFAFCEESGIAPELKASVLRASREGRARVFTDPLASPTGFPFKVVQLAGTLAEARIFRHGNESATSAICGRAIAGRMGTSAIVARGSESKRT